MRSLPAGSLVAGAQALVVEDVVDHAHQPLAARRAAAMVWP
jgi:hypothetical protein